MHLRVHRSQNEEIPQISYPQGQRREDPDCFGQSWSQRRHLCSVQGRYAKGPGKVRHLIHNNGKYLTRYYFYRYAIFELEYPTSDGRIEAKILFILYAPDICSSKEKFVIATTKDEVKKKLQPFNKEIQVNDWADLNDEAFLKYFRH